VRLSSPRTDRFWAWAYLLRPSIASRVSVFERDCESTVNIDPNRNPKNASQLAIDGKARQSFAAGAIPEKEPASRWSRIPRSSRVSYPQWCCSSWRKIFLLFFFHFLRPVYLAPNLYRMTTDREPFARPTGLRTNCLRDRGLVHGLPSLELGTLAIQSCAFPRGGKVRLHCLGCPTSQMTSGMSL